MIKIKNFSKSYGDNCVYKDFDLSVEEGKITCILGASGSGKTTLLNAIARLTPFEGEVPELKCSYVFQAPNLVPNLTVFDNLKLVCNDEAAISSMLQKVKLSDKAKAYPNKLSGGQMRRVAIARAFLYKSDIILLDEPFSSLDLKLKYEIIDCFCALQREEGRTALVVTHDVDEAVTLADRVIVIDAGKVVEDITLPPPAPRNAESFAEYKLKLKSALLKI